MRALTALLLFVWGIALGSDPDAIATTDLDSHINSTVSHASRSLGVGGSDMVINDGYRTWSALFGLAQGTQVNPLALARDLAIEGNYEAAATLRCKPRAVRSAFGGRENCITALSLPPAVAVVQPPASDEYLEDHEMEEQELHVEQQMLYADLEAKIENLEHARRDESERARRAAIAAENAAKSSREAEADRKQYAKDMLEELDEWK